MRMWKTGAAVALAAGVCLLSGCGSVVDESVLNTQADYSVSKLRGRPAEEREHEQQCDNERVDDETDDNKECQRFQVALREHGKPEYQENYRVQGKCELIDDKAAEKRRHGLCTR